MTSMRIVGGIAAMLSLALLTGSIAPAEAKPTVKTKYKSYSVPGTTAYDLLSYMQRNGPNVNGSHALASTAANIHHKAGFSKNKTCKLKNYRVSMSFVITLPRAKHASRMPRKVRRRWKQFVKHARWHENRHKAIWIGCAGKIERKIRAMGGSSNCDATWAKASAIAKAELARCDRLHAAFDRKETARASKLPLIAQALRAPRTRSGAAAIRKAIRFKHSKARAINR